MNAHCVLAPVLNLSVCLCVSLLSLSRVEGGELFDRVVSVGKFSESTSKLFFYQMLVAVKVRKEKQND